MIPRAVDFTLAKASDDERLSRFFGAQATAGRVGLSLDTRPSYFAAQTVGARAHDVLIGRSRTGDIVAAGAVSRRELWVSGRRAMVNYLGGLRVTPEYRRGLVLARGYRRMAEVCAAREAVVTLTTILESNRAALATVASGRGHMPRYEDLGVYHTLTLEPARRPVEAAGVRVRPLGDEDVPRWLAFLASHGRRRDFFPVLDAADFGRVDGPWRGLRAEDVWGAWRGHDLVGAIAAWNQDSFRRWRVNGYAGWTKLTAGASRVRGLFTDRPSLPRAGGHVPVTYASLVAVDPGDDQVVRALFDAAARAHPRRFLIAGFHASDWRRAVLNDWALDDLRSRVFRVHWRDECETTLIRDPYLDPATL